MDCIQFVKTKVIVNLEISFILGVISIDRLIFGSFLFVFVVFLIILKVLFISFAKMKNFFFVI